MIIVITFNGIFNMNRWRDIQDMYIVHKQKKRYLFVGEYKFLISWIEQKDMTLTTTLGNLFPFSLPS